MNAGGLEWQPPRFVLALGRGLTTPTKERRMASGPVPKRESQRRRANKVPKVTATSDGHVRGPELGGEHSDLGRELYEAVRRSGQAQWFEPSDWVVAKLAVQMVDNYMKRPGAEAAKVILSFTSQLLMSEADRRRIHLELERATSQDEERDAAVADLAAYRFATD